MNLFPVCVFPNIPDLAFVGNLSSFPEKALFSFSYIKSARKRQALFSQTKDNYLHRGENMKRIGFIGLGTMGLPMALNLVKKNYPVKIYNRTAEKAEKLVQSGAEQAFSPKEAAADTDVVFTMLSNDAVIREIFYGKDGLIEQLAEGQTVIDCSTVSPKLSRQLYQDLAAKGVRFLDAPVTGSKPAAESATLLFMVGGDKDTFNQHYDLLMDLGSKVLYMGPSGSGSYTKLAHNTIVGINAIGLMEGMSLAARAGLDTSLFLEIVKGGAANSRQAELKGEKIINGNYSVQFSLQLMLKDLLLASELTGEFQLPTPLLHAATSLFQMGLSKGLGEKDLCAGVQCYEEWMGHTVGHQASVKTQET
ncbi:NAD(P)-dependent oxidoreductase [Paenibacillus larvae]|uniref:NAD(P)-dependent oxidoreductase n=1 Tax=Paenibacillus larvae TaxID=1464 RepID=UPI000AF1FE6F